jgi:GTP-binding protein Era
MTDVAQQKCGFAAIIGAPNAGKSTLLNQLVGSKIAIVTHKVQTTRAAIRAIVVEDNNQIVFVDTPGIFQPKRTLDEAMVEAAWSGADDADRILLIIDCHRGLNDDVERIIQGLENAGKKASLILNKVDTIKREKLLALTTRMNDRFDFEETFMVSALTGSGVDDLRTSIANSMPQGPWLYPADQLADLPTKLLAAEITREKLYLKLHDELPYASTVETESWQVKRDGSVRTEQVIFVERESQRRIVLGHKGATIKLIGQQAREELADILGHQVHLFLFVKVRANWQQDPERLRMMGLDPKKKKSKKKKGKKR